MGTTLRDQVGFCSGVHAPVAELLEVHWLDICRKFDTKTLSPFICHEVVFVMMLKADAYGWAVPVNVTLTRPNESKQEHKQALDTKPRGRWIEVPVEEFKASPENDGEIEIKLHDHGHWKGGLVVKGVAIRPKN